MSGIGGWEVIILIMIGLIVLGPKRLPQVANQLGSWIGQARRMTRSMKRQLEEELDLDSNFKPKAQTIAPPFKSASDDPANPAYDLDEPEAHVPLDDDSYSPLHDGDDDAAKEGTAAETEKKA